MDKYDEQIAYLKVFPDRIEEDWNTAAGIFRIVGEDFHDGDRWQLSGCLTQMKRKDGKHTEFYAIINGELNLEITEAIQNDPRIPANFSEITVDMLPAFAEWQRKIDKLESQIS